MHSSSPTIFASPTLQRFVAIIIICLTTLLVFDGVLKGKQINNSAYLYAFEPWVYYYSEDVGNYNYVLSDDMDAMSISYPTRDLLSKGEFSFWNRFWQLGIPEFRIDSGWFYPLRIFWVLFGIPVGMTLEVLFRFMAGGIFTFLLLELYGVRRLVSLMAAVGYAFGSNSVGDYMYGFGPPGLTLPICFYFVERVIRSQKSLDILFLTLSLILLNTHIMVHVNALLSIWVGTYAVLRIISERFSLAVIRRLSIAIIFAPLIYAIALVPTLDFYMNYFNDSYRQEYSASQLSPGALLTVFYNRFFGDALLEPQRFVFGTYVNTGLFVGYLAGVFGIACALLRLIFKPDKIVVIIFLMTALLLMTIFEFPFESTENALGMIPLLKAIKPFYQKPLLQFLWLLFGALGLEYFLQLTKKNGIQVRLALLAMIGLQVFGVYYFLHYYYIYGHSPMLARYFTIYTIIHGLLGLAFIWLNPIFHGRFSPALSKLTVILASTGLVAMTAAESRNATRFWTPYSKKESFYPPTDTTDFVLKNIGKSRVVTLDRAAVPGLLFGYSIPVAAGRSLPRAPYLELLRLADPEIHRDHPTQSFFSSHGTDMASPIWKLADVNYFISGKNIDPKFVTNKFGDKVKVHAFKDGAVLERTERAKGYVAAYDVVLSESFENTSKLIKSGLDVEKVIIAYKGDLEASHLSNCSGKEVQVENFAIASDQVVAQVTNECPAYFMPSMFYDKGWKAYVDGEETELHLGYGFMPVIKLENSGTHRVEFTYFPLGVIYGGMISAISGAIFLTILALRTRVSTE